MIKKSINLITITIFSFSALLGKEWVSSSQSEPAKPTWDVNTISRGNVEITFELEGYFVEELRDGKKRISFPGGVPMLEEGAPELPRMARSIMVPNLAHMELTVVGSEYIDYPMDNIEPSKGNLTRDIDPTTIPYTFGKAYSSNEFYPADIVFMRDPYIMRTVRGQAVVFQPIQYNPIQRTLRVYTSIRVEIVENGVSDVNPLTQFPVNANSREFENIYQEHFLNYTTNDRYDTLSDQGPMLIISYGDFIDEMQPFVDWKNYKGIPTQIHDIADIGDVDAMDQFIEDKYYEDGIAFALLVGDIAQIETIRRSDGAGGNSPSDNTLSFIVGNDDYPDIMIGRFSAETGAHVTTMVDRTIAYEMEPDPTADWYKKGSGFASDQGPGDDGEYDYEHLDNIRDQLLAYTYIEVDQVYDPTGTVAEGEAAFNEGRSIVNYTGHGSNGSWGNGCPMNQTDVNGLVNMGMYPFIWSVACVNGEFHIGTCFAETWLRATASDGTPTGAIATMMSTVNQGWNPPMEGQDEMNAILVESYENNIKRTFGGLSFNGMMQMNDSYGSAGYDETYYWTCFGDPSVVVRTDTPTDMTISHDDVLIIGASSLTLNTGETGSLVAISFDGEMIASTYSDDSGAATLEFPEPLEVPGVASLVVTGYNKIPYETTINVIAPDGAYMLLNEVTVASGGDNIFDYGETGYLYTTFENVGQDPSADLTVTLSHDGNLATVVTESIDQNSVGAGEEVTIGPFEIQLSWNIENGEQLPFTFQITDGENTWEYDPSFPVDAPEYNLVSATFLDGSNGTLDPGESTQLEVVLTNIGDAVVNYPTFTMATSDPYISFGTVTSDNAYIFEMDGSITLTIDITATEDAPVAHTAVVGIVIGAGGTNYGYTFSMPITLGLMIEDFETGSFNAFDWVHEGDAEWTIDSDAYSGFYSAKSGAIGHNESSELTINMNILYEGNLSFFAKASSEQGGSGSVYDYLEFYINETSQDLAIGGTLDWEEYVVNLPVGEHQLRWIYQKDGAQSSGQDCAWIDRIVFPPGSVPPLNIDFGDLNMDGQVNILDVIVTVNSVLGYVDLNSDQIQNADMNLDGIVNILDVLLIVDAVLGN